MKQFALTLIAPLRPVDHAYVGAYLSPALHTLFERMPRAEQLHGIDIARQLEAQGHHDPDLIAAALLHDVGKIVAPPRLWERVIVVLVEHAAPTFAAFCPLRGFVTRRRHPQWGANLAARAGAFPRTIDLIRRHHTPPGSDAQLAALQAVDE
ncbi:MAG: HD domain-containing protein, partial [Chloroflexi bacterium]|nr:HD domain-containing protein [Chloroflexota bacterium]